MKIAIDSCDSLVKMIYEFLHLEEASIKVMREHLEHSAHLVYNLAFLRGTFRRRVLTPVLLLLHFSYVLHL